MEKKKRKIELKREKYYKNRELCKEIMTKNHGLFANSKPDVNKLKYIDIAETKEEFTKIAKKTHDNLNRLKISNNFDYIVVYFDHKHILRYLRDIAKRLNTNRLKYSPDALRHYKRTIIVSGEELYECKEADYNKFHIIYWLIYHLRYYPEMPDWFLLGDIETMKFEWEEPKPYKFIHKGNPSKGIIHPPIEDLPKTYLLLEPFIFSIYDINRFDDGVDISF